MELIKNSRFRTGSTVDIYHTPLYEGNTIAITDSSIGNDWEIIAQMSEDITAEQFVVGDIAAFSFGVGIITVKSGDLLTVEFPKSMFPDANVMKYVGSEYQHTLIFSETDKFAAGFVVAQYIEEVKQATYGYAKVVYNLQTQADIVLTPIRLVDDGLISAILYSKGYVLKSCNETNYVPTTSWDTEFPIELSGTSIDPIYRRAFLQKRKTTSKGRKSKANMNFRLIS